MGHYEIDRGGITIGTTTGNKKSIVELKQRIAELEARVDELEAEEGDN